MNVLICTGFHRSATSATALQLLKCGLDMGSQLMGAHISNPKGHVEDMGAVNLHDTWLRESGTDWTFHDEKELKVLNSSLLEQYISARDLSSRGNTNRVGPWGVKDPRACLFLEQWDNVLGDRACYLFVLRHWSSCIESILNRASRELAYDLPEINKDNTQMRFWSSPSLAAKMWLSYSERMLDFVRSQKKSCLVVTQRSLFKGAPFIRKLNTRFGFDLDESCDSVFDQSLLNDSASSFVFDSISTSLLARLNSTWSQLLQLSECKSEDEDPVNKNYQSCSPELLDSYSSILSLERVRAKERSRQETFEYVVSTLQECADESDLIKVIRDINQQYPIEFKPSIIRLAKELSEKWPLSEEVHLSLARWLQKNMCWQEAIVFYQKYLGLGCFFSHVIMSLGECYQGMGEFEVALHLFNVAIDKKPSNPQFYLAKAGLLRTRTNFESPLELLEKAYELDKKRAYVVYQYCDLLIQLERYDKAINIIDEFLVNNENDGVLSLKTRILLAQSTEGGNHHYLQKIQSKLESFPLIEWLAKAGELITLEFAERDFLSRIENHWHKVKAEIK